MDRISEYHLTLEDDFEELVYGPPQIFYPPTTFEDILAIEELGIAAMRIKSPVAPKVLAWVLKARSLGNVERT